MYGRYASMEEEEHIKAVFALVKGRENGGLGRSDHSRNGGNLIK